MQTTKETISEPAKASDLRSAFLAMGAENGVGSLVDDLIHNALDDTALAPFFGADDIDALHAEIGSCFLAAFGGTVYTSVHESAVTLPFKEDEETLAKKLLKVLSESLEKRGIDKEMRGKVLPILLPLSAALLRIGHEQQVP